MSRRIQKWHIETAGYTGLVRSGFEADFCLSLDQPFEYETVHLPYRQCKSRTYTPDVILPKKAGGFMHLELKGRLTAPDRAKMLDVKAAYPDIDLRFVFQYANKPIYKGSKTTYAMWADKYRFPWHEVRGGKQLIMPTSWLKECVT